MLFLRSLVNFDGDGVRYSVESKAGLLEARRPHCVDHSVRGAVAFFWNTEQTLVQFRVVVLIVIHRYGVVAEREIVKPNLHVALADVRHDLSVCS